MSLVGHAILGCRNAATDVARGLVSPPGSELTVVQAAVASCTLPPGSYFIKLTYRSLWGGETTPGPESASITVDGTHGIQVSGTPSLAANWIVTYIGIGAGNENFAFIIPVASLPFTITATTTIQGTNVVAGYPSSPPQLNRAYLPDTDGQAISAAALFEWLNDGLKEASAKSGGGMPDYSGMASVTNQGLYQAQGQWWKITDAWYDGYPMSISGVQNTFRKNPVPGNYAMSFIIAEVQDRLLIETWPQPSRTSGSATLTSQITSSQTGSIALSGLSGFVLPLGLASIGTEIVYYSALPTSAIQVVLRGMGGTKPQIWPAGTPVQELNIFFRGLRVAPTYFVGQASLPLSVPPGWEPALAAYMRHRFKLAEKDYKGAKAEYDQFSQTLKEAPLNKQVGGPRQIQIGGARGVETFPGLGSSFGGVLVQ